MASSLYALFRNITANIAGHKQHYYVKTGCFQSSNFNFMPIFYLTWTVWAWSLKCVKKQRSVICNRSRWPFTSSICAHRLFIIEHFMTRGVLQKQVLRKVCYFPLWWETLTCSLPQQKALVINRAPISQFTMAKYKYYPTQTGNPHACLW